ncbi:dTDP-glucose 4,6-dehydratase [Ruminiclostridium josui]|uniref:dTDP-glucose 4,6-dehydratase n=1 Tax=Ruminiclostridium josui TaxID=1499 RepID=UPI000467B2B1|nr:dTDP-glucose 4,6-dehydratase [Ruminiclostridium josui]
MKTYLITGGAGFIGSNYIRYMLKSHKDIYIINVDKLTYAGNLDNLTGALINDTNYKFYCCDICDKEKIERIFSKHKIDYVINFAAESHVDRSMTNTKEFIETNITGTVNLMDIAKKAWAIGDNEYITGVKFLQISTDEVYGPCTESCSEESPLNPHNPYSCSKAAAEFYVKCYWDAYRLPVNITRSSNNYGPYQYPEKLIPVIIHKTMENLKLPVYGDGMQLRDWIYVEDNCRAIDLVLHKGEPGEVYNIATEKRYHNRFVVDKIISYIKGEVREDMIQHVQDRKASDLYYSISTKKIREKLGWNPSVDFDKGLYKTVQWYLDNREWLHKVLKSRSLGKE